MHKTGFVAIGLLAIILGFAARGRAQQSDDNNKMICDPWTVRTGATWGEVGHAGETGFLAVVHKDLPGQKLILRMPEYANLYHSLMPVPTLWTWIGNREVKMEWSADEAVKQQHQVDRSARFVLGEDVIDVYATIRNPSDRPWPSARYDLYDVMAREAPMFEDTRGERTFVYHDGGFKSLKDVWGENLKPSGTGSMELAGAEGSRTHLQTGDRVMAKVSSDGRWVLAIASDVGAGLSFNLDAGTNCIHQNPFWGVLKAGEQREIHCRVYLIRGNLNDLWQRYVKDFRETSLHDESHGTAEPSPRATQPNAK